MNVAEALALVDGLVLFPSASSNELSINEAASYEWSGLVAS